MTSASNARSLLDLLEDSAQKHGERPLFLSKLQGEWRERTYSEVARAVRQLRASLADLGVGPGDRVAIIAGNREEWAVIAYATYGLGAVLVPMYEAQPERDWELIVRDSGAKVLFVSDAVHERAVRRLSGVPSLERVIPLSDERTPLTYRALLAAGAARPSPKAEPSPKDTATLLYTSGTTGDPKG